MNSTRLFSWLTPVLGLALALSGCLSPPEYPVEPTIDFKEMKVDRYISPDDGTATDSFRISINFRDGDGDLGSTDAEIQEKPLDYNYLLRVFQRTPPSTEFIEVFAGDEFGHYPLLNAGVDAKPAPLKGDLTFTRGYFFGSPFNAGDEVKFSVSIKDRAQHESNRVETSVYVVPKK